jgi:hypothetical protein
MASDTGLAVGADPVGDLRYERRSVEQRQADQILQAPTDKYTMQLPSAVLVPIPETLRR